MCNNLPQSGKYQLRARKEWMDAAYLQPIGIGSLKPWISEACLSGQDAVVKV